MESSRRKFLKESLGSITALTALSPGLAVAEKIQQIAGLKSADRANVGSIAIDIQTSGGPYFDAAAALDAGLTALVVDIPAYPRSFDNAVHAMAEWNYVIRDPASRMYKALSVADLHHAQDQKKLGIVLSCQDGAILDASTESVYDYNLQNLQLFYDLGMRVLTLTHNERNSLGGSFRDGDDAGLSRLGGSVVEAMNSLGMVVDLSHCGDKTSSDAILRSKKPCMVTHAGCRSLYPSLRNKPDELIHQLAERGGLFGVFNMTNWLTADEQARLDTVIDHLTHAVNVGGVDHVAFGSDESPLQVDDLDGELQGMQAYARKNLGGPGAERVPSQVRIPELNSPGRMAVLGDALRKHGYSAADTDKILGGNFVRVFGEICA